MLRWLLAIPIAGLCVLALFAVMASMIEPSRPNNSRVGNSLAFDIVMVEPEAELARRERVLPPKPEPPPPPIEPPTPAVSERVASMNDTNASLNMSEFLPDVADLSNIALDIRVTGIETALPVVSPLAVGPVGDLPSVNVGAPQEATPIVRVEAAYPPKALKRGIEGYVVIAFTIDQQGRPRDLKVIDAKPKRLFEREALRALKKWKYAPKRVDGKAIEQPEQTVMFEFAVAK
ncbi:energy transducer TonB [Enterovibrio sp. 27052020O]|uniref:energy transducer TonB n=1 Tax=Enterovibrio sp. 27052020O TaxID=3241166 RepID=UPI00388DAD85